MKTGLRFAPLSVETLEEAIEISEKAKISLLVFDIEFYRELYLRLDRYKREEVKNRISKLELIFTREYDLVRNSIEELKRIVPDLKYALENKCIDYILTPSYMTSSKSIQPNEYDHILKECRPIIKAAVKEGPTLTFLFKSNTVLDSLSTAHRFLREFAFAELGLSADLESFLVSGQIDPPIFYSYFKEKLRYIEFPTDISVLGEDFDVSEFLAFTNLLYKGSVIVPVHQKKVPDYLSIVLNPPSLDEELSVVNTPESSNKKVEKKKTRKQDLGDDIFPF